MTDTANTERREAINRLKATMRKHGLESSEPDEIDADAKELKRKLYNKFWNITNLHAGN